MVKDERNNGGNLHLPTCLCCSVTRRKCLMPVPQAPRTKGAVQRAEHRARGAAANAAKAALG